MIASLRTIAPDVGAEALALLETPGPVSPQALLTGLLNDLAGAARELVLVIDDYHVIETPAVHDGLAFLIANMPPNVHLVLASRADPPLPLARLRARGDLVEIRAADLRFTAEEASDYLTRAMELPLTPQQVSTLDDRTEGWIAALQLAALSMRGRDDIADFVAGFAGDDRYVVDYLVEEVLQNQPPEVRSFLLETSILGRMNAPLGDAVTGRSDSRAMLEALDRANLFLVALDDHRHWYRYHHLFAEVLQARLTEEQPDAVPDCTAGRVRGMSSTANRIPRSSTPSLRRTTRWRAPHRGGHAGDRAGPTRGDAARLDGGASPRRSSAHGPSSVSATPARCCPPVKWPVWKPG